MKKVLSFVLVLSMILGSFGMAFAAPTDVEGSEYKDALTVLVGLGVIDGYADGTVKPEKVVTRAEAATLIIKAMGLADYAVAKTTKFTDMDQAAWAVPFVAYAESLKIVAGKTETTFAPNEPVTSDQMIAMLVQAVGYKAEYLNGGFPGAFVNVAKGQGMLDGVKSGSEGCTRGEVAQLIYNTLDVPFVQYDKNGDITYLNDDMAGRLYADKTVSKAAIVLGTEETKIDLKPYQGLKADIIYDEAEVVAIDNIKSVFVEGDLSADAATFTLADDTEYKISVASNVAITYFENGDYDVATSTKALSALTGEALKLAVKLDGKYIKEIHSVAKWAAAGTVVWGEAYAEEVADEDAPALSGAAFVMTTNDVIDTDKFVLEGAASLDKIPEDAIVTYYVADIDTATGKEVVKVAVSTKTVEGKVSEITKKGKLVIGGAEYAVAEGAYLAEAVSGALGDEGTFFLNATGEIAKFKGVSAETNYAMVVKVASKEAIGYDSDDTYKIKLLTEDGKKTVYTMDKDAYKVVSEAAAGTFGVDKVVVYDVNAEGEVDYITTASVVSPTGVYKLTAKGYLNGVKVAKDVVVFEYLGVEDGYGKADLSAVPVDEALSATKYVVDTTSKEIVLIVTNDNATDKDVYGMVVDYATVNNDDDKAVYKVTMLVDGAEKVVLTTYAAKGTEVTENELKATSLYAFDFADGEMTSAQAVSATVALREVNKTQDGNISFDGQNYVECAADVVVYEVDKDGNVSASSFAKIAKGNMVELFELDPAEEDGYDVVIVRK